MTTLEAPVLTARQDAPTRTEAGHRSGDFLPGAEGIARAGDIAVFFARAVRGVGQIRPYWSEVLRQAGIIATGSTLVILVVTFLAGNACGQEATAVARSLGASPVAPAFVFGCSVSFIMPFLYGFILAGKLGCGFVAELGAMRVSDEIDAIEVMGVRSLVYLVGTRLVAGALVLPAIFILSIGASELGGLLSSLIRFHDVSPGTWNLYHFGFSGPMDLLLTLGQGVIITGVVLAVSLYYGFSVRGGPVEVGEATAKSMAVNLVLVTVTNLGYIMVFQFRGYVPLA